MKKRIVSILLAVMMLVSAVPLGLIETAYAVERTLYWPVPGYWYTSQGHHGSSDAKANAIDISGSNIAGTEVHAAAEGTVVHAKKCSKTHTATDDKSCCFGLGWGVVIKGSDGRVYQYGHMQANSIPANIYPGAWVAANQVIGKVGSTGWSTGPHLHFGITSPGASSFDNWGPNPHHNAGNYTYLNYGAHSMGSWKVTKQGTCTTASTETRTCTQCGYSETRTGSKSNSHSFGAWVTTKEATCVAEGTQQRTCSLCKKVETRSISTSGHKYGNWVVTKQPTCLVEGSQQRTCTVCKNVDTAVIAKAAHNYLTKTISATCSTPPTTKYTCAVCGYSYTETGKLGWSDWSTTKPPASVSDDKIQTATEYRYATRITATGSSSTMPGYEQINSTWVTKSSGSTSYVQSWPSGFSTSHYLYSQYNHTAPTAYETASEKRVINSESTVGYIYWHWCRNSYTAGPINRRISDCQWNDSTGNYTGFHAYFSTSSPASKQSDGDRYVAANGNCCKDSYWYLCTPVIKRDYTTYSKQYTFAKWSDWSDWSQTPVTATTDRKVDTRTVYRYYTETGSHVWNAGDVITAATCTSAGTAAYTCALCSETKVGSVPALGHSYRNGYCIRCGIRDVNAALGVPTMTLTTSGGKPVVRWTSVSGAAQYEVYRSLTGKANSYSIVRRTAGLSFTDTNVNAGQTYYYVVRAINGSTTGKFCASRFITCSVVLSVPTMTLTTNASTGKPVVSWAKVNGAAQYEVYRSETGKDKTFRIVRRTAGLTFTDTNTAAGKTYYYVVRAINGNTTGTFCKAQSIKCNAVLGVPTMALTTADNGSPVVMWTSVNGAAQYEVYRSLTGKGNSYSIVRRTAGLSFTDTNVNAGQTYYYVVRAINGGTVGRFCAAKSIIAR